MLKVHQNTKFRITNPVNLIITNDNNQVLLLSRNEKEDQFLNSWSIPGGGLEDLETLEDGLKREILEETNCKILEYKYFKSYYVIINNSLHVRAIYFLGKITGDIKLSSEHNNYKWFNLETINDPKISVAFNQREVINDYFKSLSGYS